MRILDSTRQQRLQRVDALLQRHPDGLRETEVAEMLGFERRSANNYLRHLDQIGYAYRDGALWFPLLHHSRVLRRFDLLPEEAMTLYLAVRLVVKHSDQRNEAAESALVRLAAILSDDMGLEADIAEAAQELAQRPFRPGYEDVFRAVMRGYIYRRKVAIIYHPVRGEPFNTILSPYLLEPSAIGYATYVIGHSSVVNAQRTFKLERIEHARLLHDEYQVPPDFPGLALLRHAWSIFHGDDLNQIVLRFHPDVVRRVQETIWHQSQELWEDPDHPGYLLMAVQVASLTDIVPWIRGWGAACEVLAPPSLRRQLTREVQRMATLYQVSQAMRKRPAEVLWAKTNRETGDIHLLLYHLIDVAQVTLALWYHVLSASFRQQMSGWLKMDEDTAGHLVAFWAGLHDIGKACPAFQRKFSPAMPMLEQVGLMFPARPGPNTPHGHVSAYVLQDLLSSQVGSTLAKKIARAVGGHHGAWPLPRELQSSLDFSQEVLGDHQWGEAREQVVAALRHVLSPPHSVDIQLALEDQNSLLVLLSGLTSVADWIGSMEDAFPYEDRAIAPKVYAEQAAAQAVSTLRRLGWLGWRADGSTWSFQDLFPQFSEPNPIQSVVVDWAETVKTPCLAILEAPTGIGKTEAAYYLAEHWLQRGSGRGIYIAMPTQATSNQMFQRTLEFLNHRFPENLVNIQLLHGQAQWMSDAQEIRVSEIADDEQHTVAAMEWFFPRKRGLLAPFAVGTVDQALLSILLTRHFFVRLFGLSHKIVIFDEVHAYDTYMSTLFHRLLTWLRRLNVSVIILSATLPKQTRQELLASYTGDLPDSPSTAEPLDYPCLTLWDPKGLQTIVLPKPASRIVQLEWICSEPDDIVGLLEEELAQGGCAVVICNTVHRAQSVFEAIASAGIVSDEALFLFHARFPFVWRQEIERGMLGRFGKAAHRPEKAVLVATQVVEQSLDLDFDLMITDLAPVDLILQRAGRLHRHERSQRPPRLKAPRLMITTPAIEGSLPVFGADEYVYDRFVLTASWLVLSGRRAFEVPADTRGLIEAVYGPTDWFANVPEPLASDLREAAQDMLAARRGEVDQANRRVVRAPDDERLLSQPNAALAEDDPEIHATLQAMTRLVEPGVTVVCLYQTLAGLALEPDGNGPINLDAPLNHYLEQQFLQRTVTIRHRGVMSKIADTEPPSRWLRSAALRQCRLAIFANELCPIPDTPFVLRLTRQLGLEVYKE